MHEKTFVGGGGCQSESCSETLRVGRCGKEKEWTDCVQSDIRAFGRATYRKATVLKAEVWVETVTECGRRVMAT